MQQNHPRTVESLVLCSSAFLALFLVAISASLLPIPASRALAPIAASAVILFVMPHSPVASTRSVLGSFFISIASASLSSAIVPAVSLRMALAVSLTIGLMLALRCVHPPGGAAAILLTSLTPFTTDWLQLCAALIVNATLLVLAARALNHILVRDRPRHAYVTDLTRDDIRSSLETLNEFIDVDEDDLLELYERAVEHARQRKSLSRAA